MLYLVGAGIYDTFEMCNSTSILKSCDRIYLESHIAYFRQIYRNSQNNYRTRKKIEFVKRWFVEDGRQILDESKTLDVGLISYEIRLLQQPFTELRIRAIKNKIDVNAYMLLQELHLS